MSLPTSIKAYADCATLYEAASADPKGARACFDTHDAAINMRSRMHYYRSLDRKANGEMYELGHPMHNTSAYDDFYIQDPIIDEDGLYWLYIKRRSASILKIEGLSEVGDFIETNATEVHLIEDHTNG